MFVSNVETDVSAFGVTDTVTKLLNSLIEKTKCILDTIEGLIGKGELGNVYEKFRTDVESILNNDVKQCAQAEGLIEKVK